MIFEVDNALRELLIREMPLKKGEVEIAFEQPKREWSSKMNRPCLNLFLFDIKENLELRSSEHLTREKNEDDTLTLRRNPVRMDLFYLVTCWTRDIQDEHRLLSAALTALLRHSTLPKEILPEGLRDQALPIRLKAAQGDVVSNITDLWSTLDNELHPGIRLMVTITVDPYVPETRKAVRTTEYRFFQNPSPEVQPAMEEKGEIQVIPSKTYFMINGKLSSQKYSLPVLKLFLRERGEEIELDQDGEFKISQLQGGEYHLDVLANERVLKQQIVQVPSPNYDITV